MISATGTPQGLGSQPTAINASPTGSIPGDPGQSTNGQRLSVGTVEQPIAASSAPATAVASGAGGTASEPLMNFATQLLSTSPIGLSGPLGVALSGPLATPNSSHAGEKERLATIHSLGIIDSGDQPRLNKITQMTARLLGGTCCVLTIVDTDKVIWKSTFWSSQPLPIKEEARYESFCSWVVQDETGRGVTILDARTDPRCVHMRVKQGLEFYAGVPIAAADRRRIGALSIRGGPRTQFSVMDMNILHEMAFWATGELETISQKRELECRETMLMAQIKLAKMLETSRHSDKSLSAGVVEKALAVIRTALNAASVIFLRFTSEGSGIKSVLHGYSTAPNTTASLAIGDEIFYELAMMTLKKEPLNALSTSSP
ncbi:hypothetical protein BC831DRAFT_58608 [Entophlyctis helioformis]|nr:hypothetical protein BC831DRAFT_58608 [Entophlyctis helioformis]